MKDTYIETGYGLATGESSFAVGVEAARQTIESIHQYPLRQY